MDINELNKLMSEKFGSVQPNKEEKQFYLYYDMLGKILGMSSLPIEEHKEEHHTFINKEKFLELQNSNIHNFVVDSTTDPVTIVDISADYTKKDINIPKLNPRLWVENRIVKLQFVKDKRTLKIKVANQLPAPGKIYVVPQGQ